MRIYFISASLALLPLIIPEIWRDMFESLRKTKWWRLIQLACVLWIIIVLYMTASPRLIEFGTKNRYAAIVLAALVGAAVFAALTFWVTRPATKSEANENNPEAFRVEIRFAFVSDSGPLTLFMAGYPSMFGETISPILYLAYVQLTNQQSVSSEIDDFKVGASKESGGQWEELVPISLISSNVYSLGASSPPQPKILKMSRGTSRLAKQPAKEDMRHAAVIEPVQILEAEIAKPIPPKTTVRGWIALDSLRHVGLLPGQIYFRIKVQDAGGSSGTYIAELPRRQPDESSMDLNCGELRVTGAVADISSFHLKYYSEPFPRPESTSPPSQEEEPKP